MASIRDDSSPQLLYRWLEVFQTHREIDLDSDNVPLYEALRSLGAIEDPISCLMSYLKENDSCPYQKEEVVRFCAGADIPSLVTQSLTENARVALFDETNDGVPTDYPRNGLTAYELYKALGKKRWATTASQNDDTQRATFGGNRLITLARMKLQHWVKAYWRQEDIKSPPALVKRNIRRIYITNVDRWSILSLASRCSEMQAQSLSMLIFSHLQWTTRLSMRILTPGFTQYALEFHLPFYALRKHKLPRRDHRLKQDAEPLRQSHIVTFLRGASESCNETINDIIYESKVSCLVSGWDCHSWVAYMLIDLYYENTNSDEDLEGIKAYEEVRQNGLNLDPFTAFETMTNALSDPREYLLRVLEIRLRKVKHEWEKLVLHLEFSIHEHINDYEIRAMGANSIRGLRNPSRTMLRSELLEWMKGVTELLTRLINTLQECDRELDFFLCKGVYYFSSSNPSLDVSETLVAGLVLIDQEHHELRKLLNKLQQIKTCCKDTLSDLNLRLAYESNTATLFQQATSGDLRILTWITFNSIPVMAAAALLSTNPGFMPIAPSPLNLFLTICIGQLFFLLVLDVLRDLRWLRACRAWTIRKSSFLWARRTAKEAGNV